MAEVRTEPVAAKAESKGEFHDIKQDGSFYIGDRDSDGETSFWYVCPCGCKRVGLLNVGNGFKPTDGPSWQWNGSTEAATLTPSVHHVGHWHGWLTDGVWRSC